MMKKLLILAISLAAFDMLHAQENVDAIASSAMTRENRLDSMWRKEEIWQLGAAPVNKTDTIKEPPRWANWDDDLEKYFVSQMKYPERLLKENRAGYAVVMFSLDTLGLPRDINILTTKDKDFDKEVIRLVRELPHCLPCRDKDDKRMECLYTVYVPFLPQHYRDRVKADSIAKEKEKHMFIEWETAAYFQKANARSPQDYICGKLAYDPALLGEREQVRGIYQINVNSYGEVVDSKVSRSCGMSEWDDQVLRIIKGMPRWTPAVNHYGKGEYRSSVWVVPIIFSQENLSGSGKIANFAK